MQRQCSGDVRWIGAGVFEMRIDFGPGYRVYDISVQPSADPKIGDIAEEHPEHPAHPHSDLNQLASFKFR